MSHNKILERREVLEASLSTINYKIANLKQYFSREQVRCWYIHRNRIAHQLKELPTPEQVAAAAKRNTAFRKQPPYFKGYVKWITEKK